MSKYGVFSGTYLLRKSSYSAQIWENKDQKKLRIWTPFTQWLWWTTANSFSYMYLPYISDDDLILLCCCLIPKCKVGALGMFLLFFVLVYSFCWLRWCNSKIPILYQRCPGWERSEGKLTIKIFFQMGVLSNRDGVSRCWVTRSVKEYVLEMVH